MLLKQLVVKILPNVELAWRGHKPANCHHYFHDDDDGDNDDDDDEDEWGKNLLGC